MTTKTEIVKSEGITLPKLIWRLLRRQPPGYAERVLAANPGLSDSGPFLPVGAKVVFPLDDIPLRTPTPEVVRLWD